MGRFSSKPSQNRHPERSAYTDCARAMALGGAQSKDPDDAHLLMLFGAFQPPKPE